MKHIVKRKGHEELFDERKVYASCYVACLSAHMHHSDAEKICEKVTMEVSKWINTRKKVSSSHIFKQTASTIRKYHKEAAFMYETHRDIC